MKKQITPQGPQGSADQSADERLDADLRATIQAIQTQQRLRRRTPQLAADQRIFDIGYSRGYEDGRRDGEWKGEEALQAWLLAELNDLVHDVRLELRHDVGTPLEVLAQVMALIEEGRPISPEDESA